MLEESAPAEPYVIDWAFIAPFEKFLFSVVGDKVLKGLFQGMLLSLRTVWQDGSLCVKVFGDYELELEPYFKIAVERKPAVVVNIGCSDGYYAVGLARLLPDALVYAFDKNTDSIILCAENAEKNNVQIKTALGCNQPEELSVEGTGRRLYVVDCEGYEYTLLDPERCPVLRNSDIIVEYHDFFNIGKSSDLIARFLPTHEVVQVASNHSGEPFFEVICKWKYMGSNVKLADSRPDGNAWLVCWAREG